MLKKILVWLSGLTICVAAAQDRPVEVHDRLSSKTSSAKRLALALDACSGRYDDDLVEFLIRNRIPATIFATKKWLDHNPFGVSLIKAHLDLFDHGENHIPAVIGANRKVYGLPGEPDAIHLRRQLAGRYENQKCLINPTVTDHRDAS